MPIACSTSRCLRGVQIELKHRLGRAYFTDGEPIGEPATLRQAALDVGLDPDEVDAVLEGDAFADDVRADIDAARRIGVSGVPFFVVDGRLGVSGAQPPESLLDILEQGWLTREPAPVTVVAGSRRRTGPAAPTAARSDPGPIRPRPVASTPVSRIFAVPPWPEVRRRLPRLILGLVLCGVAFACIVQGDLGLDPWDVLHQGLADKTGLPIGTVSVLVSCVVVLGWIPLRQRVGLGTVINAVLIGMTMDVVIPLLPDPHSRVSQWALLVAGLIIAGPGIGMYIGARLGPGPATAS